MIRYGLCCRFDDENLKNLRMTTATHLLKLDENSRKEKIENIIIENTRYILESVEYCIENNIKNFRVPSNLYPCMSHPIIGYSDFSWLKDESITLINSYLDKIKEYEYNKEISLTIHPDQFVVLNSPTPSVVNNALRELKYQEFICTILPIQSLILHVGGCYNNKKQATERFKIVYNNLTEKMKELLVLENDDTCYNSEDVMNICEELRIPFVFDVHHHRINKYKCNISIEDMTQYCVNSFKNYSKRDVYPIFHISSPRYNHHQREHSDYIDIKDFPEIWNGIEEDIIVEVEAKKKEKSVKLLMEQLYNRFNIEQFETTNLTPVLK